MLDGQHHADQLLRFGEAARLDDDDVDAGGRPGQTLEVGVEFAGVHGAAEASVAERDGGVAERSRDGHGIDLDVPEIVDDGADAAASAVVEEMVEQRGLARTQESGEDDDRDLLRTRRPAQRTPLLPPTGAPDRVPAVHEDGSWTGSHRKGAALVRGLNAESGYERGETLRSERLLAALAGHTFGMAPGNATRTSLRAPPLRLPADQSRSAPWETASAPPSLAGPLQQTRIRRPADGRLIRGLT